MGGSRKVLGQWGEKVAAEHLVASNYNIICRNWRCHMGEIDIIAQKEDVYVFVEVKTRRGMAFGSPEEAVTVAKQRKLIELAQYYFYEHEIEDEAWRVDVIAIQLDRRGKLVRCHHIEDAVSAY